MGKLSMYLLLGFFTPLALFGQVDILSGTSSSECYTEQSSNVTYTFDLEIAGVDANSVTFATTSSGISFSNPVGGNSAGTQAVDFNNTFIQGQTHSFTFDISALNNSGVVNITATVSGVDNTSDTYTFGLSFVSANPITSVICNSHVNITLDTDCENVIHPDQILEGGNYYCWDLYTVNVLDANGNGLGNTVGYAQIDQTLQVEVRGPNNNVCWGQITVEDKFAPVFHCQDIITSCIEDVSPGASLSKEIYTSTSHNSVITNLAIQNVQSVVSGMANALIATEGVLITLDITHPDFSELSIVITSPEGTSAAYTNNSGQTFTAFNGENPNGNWSVVITDNVGNGLVDNTVGVMTGIAYKFNQTGGTIAFPVTNNLTVDTINHSTYLISKGLDACSTSTIQYNDSVQNPGCGSPYAEIITRTWFGQDESNNGSGCTQTIYVYRTGLSDIVWPPSYDDTDQPSLSCVTYGNLIPPVDSTGMPTGYLCDNIEIFEPVDIVLPVCENSYKLIRTWSAIDWCTGVTESYDQVIKVENQTDPIIICPEIQTISTHPYSCNAEYNVVPPDITYNCSTVYNWSVAFSASENGNFTTNGVSGDAASGYMISGLPIGRSWVRYYTEDGCGNRAECTTEVDVFDQIDPYPVCDEHTVVSIQGFSNSFAEAISFDDGSTDNCGISHFEVRKLVNICTTDTLGTAFGPTVMFCCDEVNTTVEVELLVWDTSNNSSSCIVEVTVQDLLPPYFTNCPGDITIECGTTDYLDHSITGMPIAIDNCTALPLEEPLYNVDINSCGEGIVTKTWTVFDLQGYKDVCVQTIHVVNDSIFLGTDIVWPEDYETPTCNADGLDPEDLPAENDRPDLSNSDVCDMVSSTHIDQTFPFGNGGIKILRKWSVIDWCRYPQGGGYWEYEQIIKCENASGSLLTIGGMLRTENNDIINNVEVTINSNGDGSMPQTMINDSSNGSYSFTDLQENESYTVSAEKDDDPVNGVTTLDLILIQRHLLGSAVHDSPYKIIASDIDGNGGVSALDLIHLRKLILGWYTDFPNNQKSWIFVKEDAVFADVTDPFPFIEVINAVGINQPLFQEDFIGIKTGDVSGDANPVNATQVSDNRSAETTELVMRTENFNNESRISFYLEESAQLKGFQMSIALDESIINEIIPGIEGMDETNFAIHDDHVAFSWNTEQDVYLDENTPVFSLVLSESTDLSLSDQLRAEAYDATYQVSDIRLKEANDGEVQMELHQNVPNPFSTSTTISYEVSAETRMTLKVYDVDGKVVLSSFANAKKGYNEMVIDADNLPSGILYYQIESRFGYQTKKMIVIK